MTQQTNIADIVKPLEWEDNDGTIDAYVTTESNRIEYIGYQVRLGGPNEFLVRFNEIVVRPITCHKTLSEAQDHIWRLHVLDMEDRLNIAKLQPQPEGFWKPIEQCPKVEGIFYLLRSPSGTPFIGTIGYDELGYYWAVGLDKEPIDFYTHFAEIQACEVQP